MKAYYSLYFHNIQKFLKRKNKTFAVLGHLHTPHRGENFKIIGSFHDGHVYENENIVAISDVHLGIYDYSKEEIENLKALLNRPKIKIILLGDFFDLFYSTPKKLKENYSDIIELIKKKEKTGDIIYIRGNYDKNITKNLGIPSVREYIESSTIFFHGHTCDPLYTLFPFNIFQYLRAKLGYSLYWLRPLYLKFHS